MSIEDMLGATLSPEENKFFETGGESSIPTETGADNAGGDSGVTNTDGDGSTGGNKSADQGNKPNEKAPQHVPLAALQEERTKRKALGDTVKSLETQLAEFRGKFSILERLNQKPGEGEGGGQGQGDGAPKPEDDIFGAVNAIQKRLDDEAKASKEAKETAEKQTAFVNDYRSDAAAFEAKTPDYRAAYNHLLSSRASELIAIGYDDPKALQASGASPQEVHAAAKALHDAIVADEYAIAQLAFSKKKSPAEIIYGLATQRGYKKADASGGGEKKPAPGAEKLDAIERGQQANKSLNGTGGTSDGDEMTAERLLAMPMDEFEAWAEKHPAKVKRIMGG